MSQPVSRLGPNPPRSGVAETGGQFLARHGGNPPPAASAAVAGPQPLAVKPYEATLGGKQVRATPITQPNERGQTTYRVDWGGVAVDVMLTGQFGPRQLAPGSATKQLLEQAVVNQPRRHDFIMGGVAGSATPYGPPDANGRTRYLVAWNGAEVDLDLTGRFTDRQLVPGSPAKRLLDATIAARKNEEATRNPQVHRFTMGGVHGVAVPLETDPLTNQTLYEVDWNNRRVEARLTGQLTNEHLKDGSPTKRMLLAATPYSTEKAAVSKGAASREDGLSPFRIGMGSDTIIGFPTIVEEGTKPAKLGSSVADLVNIDPTTGKRAPSAREAVMKAAQQDPNPERVTQGDPNAPRHEQRYAGSAEKVFRGGLHEVASGLPGLTTLVGKGVEMIGLGSGLRKTGEAWQGNVDKFYGGGPDRDVADLTGSAEWEKGKMAARVGDFATGVIGLAAATSGSRLGANAVRAGAAKQQAAARSANAAARSADAVADFATTAGKAKRTLPPGFQFDGPPVAMRAPDLVPPKATASMPKANPTAGSASIAADIASNPPTAPRGTPKLGQNTVTRAALVDDVKKMGVDAPDLRPRPPTEGSPVDPKVVAKRLAEDYVNANYVPHQSRAKVQAAVEGELARLGKAADTPEAGSMAMENYVRDLANRPHTRGLINHRMDVAAQVDVKKQIGDFLKKQPGLTNRDRNNLLPHLEAQLKNLSPADAAKRLGQISRNPQEMQFLLDQGKVSAPKYYWEPNLLNDRARPKPVDAALPIDIRDIGVVLEQGLKSPANFKKLPNALYNALDPVKNVADFGKWELGLVDEAKQFVVQKGRDTLGTVLPAKVQDLGALGVDAWETSLDGIVNIGNWTSRKLQDGSNLLPEAITIPATKTFSAVAKIPEVVTSISKSDPAVAAKTFAANGVILGGIAQAEHVEFSHGIVGEDPKFDAAAGFYFTPKGARIAMLETNENSDFYWNLSATAYGPQLQATGAAANRFAFSAGPDAGSGSLRYMGTNFFRFFAGSLGSTVAKDKEGAKLMRASVVAAASLGGASENRGIIGVKPLPNQHGSGFEFGQALGAAPALPSIVTYAPLTFFGVSFGERIPNATGSARMPNGGPLSGIGIQGSSNRGAAMQNNTYGGGNQVYGRPDSDVQIMKARWEMDETAKRLHDWAANLMNPGWAAQKERIEEIERKLKTGELKIEDLR